MSDSYLVIELNHQPVELCKLLKIADLVGGGGEAKIVISEGYVLLNGEVEYQKRKKVYHEDVIEFNGEVVQLIINEALVESTSEQTETEPTAPSLGSPITKTKAVNDQANTPSISNTTQKKAKSNKTKPDPMSISQDDNVKVPKKRRPISF
ncbi:RNA-binding S4 domain-containing protein [Colwellia psychrerythraea]|uniref:Uncharacterized protein n=1 Tax=Colwellia psychrerythraea TaxID=28229 RepID=A0A099K7D6_COLPS|nr:RNA-binding S4 domain-containing protein [Colwellia psychrerythraea]KGJ86679.1 hypothetical protein ND2E_0851 [Colwellia psychrerythraea]